MSEPQKPVHDVLTAALERAESMERGGNLEALLVKEAGPLLKAFFEEALKRRQQTAEASADFPPSGMSSLP